MNKKHNNDDGGHFLRTRSISEPEINFEKNSVRFKSKHFPFEYIPVDDLHYYRRRKPCNCKRNLFQSTLSLCNNNFRSEPNLNGRTEYRKEFKEKHSLGKLPPLKRPPYLKVDAYPFLTGLYKSDNTLNSLNYTTEYDTNFFTRPYSPRIGPIFRPPNIQVMPGIMDIRSEQKSQFLPYHSDVVTRARPPAIRRPNNLHLIGNIELFPEYRSKYISHNFSEVDKINRVPCFHTKRDKKSRKVQPCNSDENRNYDTQFLQEKHEAMEPRKLYHNNDSSTRYHEKFDCENNNYIPEYRSKYGPNIGVEKSALIPQHSHFMKHDGDEFNCTSEYNNRYKSYDQFTKSAPIKKEDNLYMKGQAQMQPEYKDRYKEIDLKSYVRQQPIKHQNNLYPDGNFLTEMPEYAEKYKRYNSNAMPEKSKGRDDFLQLNGDMEYDTLHRSNYVEFPRQRPIVRKPSTHIQLSSQSPREERKPDNLNLPINVPYHEASVMKQVRDDNEDEVPFESTPEYRKALRNYMLKERSPSRGSPSNEKKQNEKVSSNVKITIDHNDVSKILTENKVNVPEEKIYNENNEVIVEPLKKPDGFKIPTRSPTSLNLGRVPTYPIDKNSFNERASIMRKPRKHYDVSFEDEEKPKISSDDFIGDFDEENAQLHRQPQQQQGRYEENYERPPPPHPPVIKKRSPPVKFGRRATNPKEDYMIRKKTSVIEGNSTYTRDYCANRHEQKAYPHHRKTNALPFASPPADSLSNNYRPNYELDKQVSYREALGNREPFVVLDRESQQRNKLKQSSWMKKQWYDTN